MTEEGGCRCGCGCESIGFWMARERNGVVGVGLPPGEGGRFLVRCGEGVGKRGAGKGGGGEWRCWEGGNV